MEKRTAKIIGREPFALMEKPAKPVLRWLPDICVAFPHRVRNRRPRQSPRYLVNSGFWLVLFCSRGRRSCLSCSQSIGEPIFPSLSNRGLNGHIPVRTKTAHNAPLGSVDEFSFRYNCGGTLEEPYPKRFWPRGLGFP